MKNFGYPENFILLEYSSTCLHQHVYFKMKITGVYGGDATKRQVAEAVRIQHGQGPNILNKRDE